MIKHETPPFETIREAVTGEVCAINAILRHYNGYILSIASRYSVDPSGKIHTVVDSEMKNRLETKLITRILRFRIA